MCAASTTDGFNYYASSMQLSAARRSATVRNHYFGTYSSTYSGTLNIPGILNLFCAPGDIKASVRDRMYSVKTSDAEGVRDNSLLLIEAPFNVVSSGFANIEIVTTILS